MEDDLSELESVEKTGSSFDASKFTIGRASTFVVSLDLSFGYSEGWLPYSARPATAYVRLKSSGRFIP